MPTPMYGRICTDFKQRALVDVWPIPIITEVRFLFTIKMLGKKKKEEEEKYKHIGE